MDINKSISALLDYGEHEGLYKKADRVFTQNSIIAALGMDSFEYSAPDSNCGLREIQESILSYARENGLCGEGVTEGDLFDTKLMALMLPRPSEVIEEFSKKYAQSPRNATQWYYAFSRKSDYIRDYRIANDVKWITKTEYGDIDITINLSKPEKDPKAIAAAGKLKSSSYPKCMLCRENEGYAGRLNHPARQNHRMIPVQICGAEWFLQYSPYVYYNEHCIVLNGEHVPMVIDREAFKKLFDFVRQFPHYFVGSNADLPIVGGSILSHEHFQGGNYEFAMAKAPVEAPVVFKGFEDVEAGIVKWPMSVIRITSADSTRLVELGDKILTAWRNYTDEASLILAQTDGVPHSTVTPIARMVGGKYQLDIVLRNNITTDEYPDGVYHPHPEYHHIKKENIGLIEVMGLAVLPSRLKTELAVLADAIAQKKDLSADEATAKHAEWARDIMQRREVNAGNVDGVLKDEVGKVFAAILEQCGVFSHTAEGRKAFMRFIATVE